MNRMDLLNYKILATFNGVFIKMCGDIINTLLFVIQAYSEFLYREYRECEWM